MQCTWYAGDGNTANGPGDYVSYNSFASALAVTAGFGEPDVIWGSIGAFWNKDGSAPYVSIIYTAAGVHQGWNWQIGIVGSPQADKGFGNLASAQAALSGAQASPLLPSGFCTVTTSNPVTCDPTLLAAAARCYCLPDERQRAAWIYLLCQYANKSTGPTIPPQTSDFTFSIVGGNAVITVTENPPSGFIGFQGQVRQQGVGFWAVSFSPAPGVAIVPFPFVPGLTYEAQIGWSNSGLDNPQWSPSLTFVAPLIKLVFTSLPPSGTAAVGFSATVQAQDASNNPLVVSSNTTVTLSVASGNGVLSGVTSGTILSGTSSVVISGVIYSNADSPQFTATVSSGIILSPVTTSPIAFGTSFTYQNHNFPLSWTDSLGTHSANLATFKSTARETTLTALNGNTAGGISSISGFTAFPLLNNIQFNNTSIASVDLSGLPNLTYADFNFAFLAGPVNLTGSTAISYLDLSGNNLPVGTVNTVLSSLAASGVLNGTLNLSGQTPAAVPTVGPPNGIVAKATLIANGWTVTTDTTPLHALATAWAARVVVNGGAAPSVATVDALSTFCYALDAASITAKMLTVNCFVPDNLIASITPLIKGLTNDPWLNTGFVAGDLSVNGLKGNASNKYLDPVFVPSSQLVDTDAGLTLYQSEFPSAGFPFGVFGIGASSEFGLSAGFTGNNLVSGGIWKFINPGQDYLASAVNALPGGVGYASINRTSSTTINLYGGSTALSGPALLVAGNGSAQTGSAIGTYRVLVFALNVLGTPSYYSDARLSFAAIHHGLIQTESAALYSAVQALRTAFGGGYV